MDLSKQHVPGRATIRLGIASLIANIPIQLVLNTGLQTSFKRH